MKRVKKKNSNSSNFFSVFAKPKSYLNMFYMLLLFPLGIITFVILVTLLALSAGLIGAPIAVLFGDVNLGPNWTITSFPIKMLISFIFCILGIFILTASLYVFNGISWIIKRILNVL